MPHPRDPSKKNDCSAMFSRKKKRMCNINFVYYYIIKGSVNIQNCSICFGLDNMNITSFGVLSQKSAERGGSRAIALCISLGIGAFNHYLVIWPILES